MSKKKKLKRKQKRQAPVIESLEPRILLSADLPGLDAPDIDPNDPLDTDVETVLAQALEAFEAEAISAEAAAAQVETDAEPAEQAEIPLLSSELPDDSRRELIIVDPSVPDYELLLADVNAVGGEDTRLNVVLIDPQRSGIEQISEILASRSDLAAIHLISHGSDAAIRIGGDTLDVALIQQDPETFSEWGGALSDEGDILIYGCNVAETEAGQVLIDTLAEMTRADVAASDDLTGHESLGGDWDLEYRAGEIEASLFADETVLRDWTGTLDTEQVSAEYLITPLAFEENKGQTDEAVDFLSRGDGYSVFLTDGDAVIRLANGDSQHVVKLNLVDSNSDLSVAGQEQLVSRSNYLIGDDASAWQAGVDNFASVYYEDVYEGVDLRYYGNQRQLEYDFVVDPGSDPNEIRLSFDGIANAEITDAGELRLILNAQGDSTFFKAPISYQTTDDGTRTEVESAYVIHDDGSIGFTLGDYDSSRELVIDPILDYTTFVGGTGYDALQGIAADVDGNVYITGWTASTDFPTTAGAFDPTYGGGSYDIFVAKLSPDGSSLLYSTFIGGSGSDMGNSIAVDSSGNVYVTGQTTSTDFATVNAYQNTLGGTGDAVVLKLNSDGDALLYSSYFGGTSATGSEVGYDLALDDSGIVYVAGQAYSADMPLKSAYDATLGGTYDAFVAKFDLTQSGASSLLYSSLFGGSGGEYAKSIAVDSSGAFTIAGMTDSADLTTMSAFQASYAGGTDAFVTRFNTSGTAITYSTYIGGSTSSDWAEAIAVDASGAIYVGGKTAGGITTTAGAFDTTFNAGSADGFVAKVDPMLSGAASLAYSTYLGSGGFDYVIGVDVDDSGVAYLTGFANAGFPTTADGYDRVVTGSNDGFFATLSADGSSLTYSTFLGGDGQDRGMDVVWNAATGSAYVGGLSGAATGWSGTTTTQGTLGDQDAFVIKYTFNQTPTATADSYTVAEGGTLNGNVISENTGAGVDSDPEGDSLTASVVAGPLHGSLVMNPDGSFTYTPFDEPASNFADTDSFTYQVSDGNGGTDTATVNISVTPDATNEAPVNSVPGAQTAGQDLPLVFSQANGNRILLRDDAGGNVIELTLTATNGTVTLAGTTGLTVTGGADGSSSVTVQGTLTALNSALDGLVFNPTASYFGGASLQVTTNDLGQTGSGVPGSDTDAISITVNEVNYTPVITSNGGGATASISVAENTFAVTTVTASDANTGDTLSYAISGPDAALFDIDSVTGALTFKDLPDFESPADANLDNDYLVTVTVSDGNGESSTQDITVTVTQITDPGIAVWSDTSATPRFGVWDGDSFGASGAAAPLDSNYRTVQGADAPTRDEKIVVGVNAVGGVIGEMWNGSSWSAFKLDASVSETYWWGVEVAYEQLSGDAIVVFNDNSKPAGDKLRYQVWDGSSWTTAQSISAYTGAEPQTLRLAFDPGSDAMVLMVGDASADDHALVWDGDSWGNAVTLDTSGTAESDQSAIAVSFEAESGNALVTYGKNGDTDVYYRVWNGTAWEAESSLTAAAGVSGEAKWLVSATDYLSDSVVLGTLTSAGEVWLSVWDGSAWEAAVLAEPSATDTNHPKLAVAFESTTGQALATYADGVQSVFHYRTWDAGSGWSAEQDSASIGGVPNTMTLDSGPTSDHIMLSIQDSNSDLHYLRWNGSAWGADNTLSTNTGETKNQPFVFVYDQDGMLVDPNAAPVNAVPAPQSTAINTPVVFSTANGNLISVADTDDTSAEVTLAASNGTLTLSGLSGLSFSVGDGSGDASMTFAGTLADINDALDGLQFDPTAAFEGFASVQISTTDFAGGGAGGTETDLDSITIEVGDVNTAPVNMVPAAQSIEQDGMLLFSASTGTAIAIGDVDAGGAPVEVTLTATDGTLNLQSTQGLTFSTGDGTADTAMTFTGTVADINAALEGMTFVATPGFTGAAGLQIVTDDLGNSGAGGAQTDSDTIAITVAVPDHTLWMTFETDQATTGNPELPNFTGGDVVNFGDTLTFESGTTSGTFSKNFNLDLISGTDGDTNVDAVHYVTRDISVGGIDLQAGDLLLSCADKNESIGGIDYNKEDVFVFRPTTSGDYSTGSFFLLIAGKASGVVGDVTGISLVEQDTVVGGVTLNAGDFLVAHGGSTKNIIRFEADQLGATTSGTTSVLVQGADIDFGQNIGALHLVQEDTAIGDTSLQAGQLLVGLVGNDSAVGDAPTIDVLRQDLFVLDVTATGAGTSAATATRFFEGLDENLDSNNESIWGVSAQYNVGPTTNDAGFSLDENSAGGTVVGSVNAADPELGALKYAIIAGNTDGAFAIDAITGQITVANSTALDFETTPSFALSVAAIDPEGAYDTSTVTINLNDLVENTTPTTTGIADFTVNEDAGFSFIDLKVIFDDVEDADSALVFSLENNTNPSLFDATTINGSGVLTLDYAADQNGTADITVRATDSGGLFVETTFTVTVNAVNDGPTVSGLDGDVLNYTEGDGVVVIEQGGDALVADIDSIDFDGGSLNVECDSGLQAAEDVFSIRNQGTSAGQIGVSGSNVTYGGVLIGTFAGGSGLAPLNIVFNANATSAAVTALVQNITYENTNTDDPTAGARSVTIDIADGDGGAALSQNATVNVSAVNDAPGVTTTGSFNAHTENDGPAVIDTGLALSDVDSPNLASAQVRIVSGFSIGEDVLAFTNQLGITGSYGAATGILSLTGSASVADYQTALRSVTYENTSEMPSTTNRVISFQVNDGASNGTGMRTVSVASINDDPTNNGTLPSDVTVLEGVSSVVDLSAIDFSDLDHNNQLLTVTLTTSAGGRLYASTDIDVIVSGSGGSIMTLTGGLADLNTFFDSASRIQYLHGTSNIAGDNADTVQVRIRDNGNTGTGGGGDIDLGTVNVDITNVNDAPSGTDNTVSVNEDTDYTFTAGDFGFGDTNDSPANSLTSIIIATAPSNGTLYVDSNGDSFVDGGEALAATDTVAVADIIAGRLKFKPVADAAGTGYDSFTFKVQDDGGTANSGVDTDATANTITVDVAAVNDAPIRTAGSLSNLTVAEDSGLTSLGLGSVAYGPGGGADESGQTLSYSVTAIPLVAVGDIFLADGTTRVTTGPYSLAQIQGMQFKPADNASGTTAFQFNVTDSGGTANGGTDGVSQFMTITVSAVNDAPTFDGADAGAVTEDVDPDVNTLLETAGTLTISDPDAGESSFQAETVVGTYGSLTIDTAGNWAYSADNTQLAVQQLDVSETLTDTLTVTAFDGATHNVTITINGAEDAPVITGTVAGGVTEGNVGDAPVTATGSISISDTDSSDAPVFNDVASTVGDNAYGSFVLSSGTWTYTLDQSAVQDLDAGDVVNDTITYTATDGSIQQITVSITGTDDSSVITGTVAGAVTEGNVGDAPVTATGSISISDVDADDNPVFNDAASTAGDNGYGSFALSSGTWTYTLNQSAVQDLDAGDVVNDTITYTATDGSTQQITVTITGTNDNSVITGTVTGTLTEGNVGDGPVTATGSIAISDVDADDSPTFNDVVSTVGDNAYGSFELTVGSWTYTLDQTAVQDLDAGDVVNDTITYTATDGSTQTITVTITGTNDNSVITGTVTGAVTEGNVGDAPVTATGSIAISDVDADDSPVFNDVASTAGDNAYGSFALSSGTWTYTIDQAAVQYLDAGESVTDTITFAATDGSTQVVTVTVNGSEDLPTLDTVVSDQAATEDTAFSFTFAAITFGDLDTSDSLSFTATLSDGVSSLPGWLSFVDNGDGTGTFSGTPLNTDVGTVSIRLVASDGSGSVNDTFDVVVANANDAPTIGGVDTGAVTEDVDPDVDTLLESAGILTISDPDAGESSFQAGTVVGTYGSLTIDTAGNWAYSADNTQSAVQQLDVSETLTDTLTVSSFDGTTHDVTITINGAEDAPVITGTVAGAVTEGSVGDAPVTATGSLSISDADSSDTPVFNDVASTVGDNGFGSFTLASGAWTYTLDQSAVQDLDAGDVVNDTITYTATDGSTQQITVAITGTDDNSIITGTVAGAVTEGNVGDAPVTATGSIAISDIDTDDSPAFSDVASIAGDNGYGSFALTGGTWTYTLDQSAVQDLDADDVVNDTITYTATDGSTQQITVAITGTDDSSVITGTVAGAVTEGNVGDMPVTATGSISISDIDTDDSPAFSDVASTAGDNAYGSFVLSGGSWTYTLDQSAVQDLDADDVVNDTITYAATDGSTQQITVAITGTDDNSIITGTVAGAVTEGNVGDAPVTATGSIAVSDVDADDSPVFNDVASMAGDNAYGSFALSSGTWVYTLDQSAVQDLDAGDLVTDTITYTATDGSTQAITVSITGTNDNSVITGTTTGAVTEGNVGDAPVTATGSISISDVDADDTPVFNDVASTAGDNAYGNFALTGGTWTYMLDQTAVQDLDAGDIVNDTITFTATDGSTQQVTVSITGTDDNSVITGTVAGAVTEGDIGDVPVTATGSISISDVDADDSPVFNDVASTVGGNGYGAFELVSGTWTYTLGQTAVQDLDAGDVVTDTITYTSTDGTTQQITVSITGTDDSSVITGTATGAVTEGNVGDAPVTAIGSIAISDVDVDDSPTFNDVASTAGDNAYGSFALSSGTWTYTLDQSAVQDLDAGDVVNDTITYTATDGSTQQITVSITGTNDNSVVTGTVVGAVTEGNVGDAPVTATGSIAVSDVDADDSPVFNDVPSMAGDNAYGSFVLSGGTWTYSLDQSAVQDLDAGDLVNDTITYTATDGSTQQITVSVTGTADSSVITGTVAGAVTEGNVGDAPVTATGSIAISDVDADDSPAFIDAASTVGDNAYGSFTLTGGAWTYTLDQSAVQGLDAGDSVNDTITYTATDGSTQQITVSIAGTDDNSVITGTVAGAVTEGNVGDAPVMATGSIAISDVDADDSPVFSDVGSTVGANGYGSFVLSSGTWTYTLDQSAVQGLDAGDVVSDTITYTATDGSTQQITVSITGADDDSVITGTVVGAVTEGNVGDAPVTATGSIAIGDVDANDSPVFNDVGSTAGDNGYGSFALSSGTWTYTLDQSAVQDLDADDVVNDTITFTATDGATRQISVSITGTDDSSVITGTATGAVIEGNVGDAPVTATGSISISDIDADDSPTFNDVASTAGDNAYGSFELTGGTWTYTLDQSAVQYLDAGQSVTDSITYTATDGSTQVVTVTVNGSEDLPTLDNAISNQSATEDTAFSFIFAAVTFGDLDTSDSLSFTATLSDGVTPLPGWLSFVDNGNGTGTFSGTPTNGDVGTVAIRLVASDGAGSVNDTFDIVVGNTNDAPVFGGTETGAVTEDVDPDVDTLLETSGTLTIADPDAGESSFQAGTVSGTYGNLTIDTAGNWAYSADNTQAAIQQLDVSETLTDTLTVTAFDGTTHDITITINGAEDAPVVSGTTTGTVTEGNIGDAPVTATGSISISDTDSSDTPVFNDVASTVGDDGYGSFALTGGTWIYILDQSAVQDLDVGDLVTDTITFTATDGSTQQITVSITGTDDSSVITGTATGAVTEGNIGDAPVTATGSISISDVDADDSPSFTDMASTVGDNGYGSFELTGGSWTYTLDQSAVQDLDTGDLVSDSITYMATDGSTQAITVSITGTNDNSVITGTTTGAVTEGNVGDAPVTATGSIAVSDVDADDTPVFNDVASTAGDNAYGSFALSSGTWVYTLDQSAVQDQDAGDVVNDTITFTATDGSTQVITVSITGTDDNSVITGTVAGAVTEGNIGDVPVTATGSISISDVDADDSPVFNDVASTVGGNGYGAFELVSGTWTYTLGQAAVQELDAGDVVNDTITFTATDGSTQVITVSITGTDDNSVITGTVAGAVTEGNVGDAPVTATGSIAVSDVDADDSPVFNDVASTAGDNAYGSFALSSGTWSYTLDQSAVQDLDAGDVVNDTITYTATDGSTQVITVSIMGTDDTSVITGTVAGAVTEGNVGDAPVTATGSIAVSDVDVDDSPVFNDVASTVGDNAYGSFALSSGTWVYTLDQSAVQDLDAGAIVNDTITFTATDGSTQQITVSITGTDDSSVITGTAIGAVTEGNVGDTPVTATGSIAISDVDAGDSPVFSDVGSTLGDNAYGSFVLSGGTWTYTLDQSAVQDLDAGDVVNDTITFTATDGATRQIAVSITGTDDSSVITGTATGAVIEGNVGDAPVMATGAIAISDVDADDSPVFNDVASTVGDNGYGSFQLVSGTWDYTLDQTAVQGLDAGESVTDTLTFTATDGSTLVVAITINGAEDAAVIIATSTGTVAEDGTPTANGTLAISDVDTNDNPVFFPDEASIPGDNGYGTFELIGGNWTYTLDNANPVVQALDVGDTLTDTYSFTASDGSTQIVSITISGSEDVPVIAGVSTGVVAEDTDTRLEAAGTLTINDPDAGESNFVAGSASGSYGALIIDETGNWSYEADNTQAGIQQLDAGESMDDVLTVTTADGTTHNVTVTINGTEDAAVVGGTVNGAVAEEGTLTAGGRLTISDADTSDNPVRFPDEANTAGDNGYGEFSLSGGHWTYTLNNTHAVVQALEAGASLTDTHTFTASDGSTQVVSVVISGSDELVMPSAESTLPDPGPVERSASPETEQPAQEPVEEVAEPASEPEAGRTDPSAEDPGVEELPAVASVSSQPQPLEPDEILLSVLADARPHDSPSVKKMAASVDKPTVETAQTFLQELKSIWKDDSRNGGIEMSEVRLSKEFWDGLDKMSSDMDESVEEQERKIALSTEAAAGVGISMTAGFVSWALRAGSMAASFLTAMPTWKNFDPMPILGADEKKRQGAAEGGDQSGENEQEDEKIGRSVDDLFER